MTQDSKPEIPAEIMKFINDAAGQALFEEDYYNFPKDASINVGKAVYRKLQADKPTGLRWVKASERLPTNNHELPIKILDGGPPMYSTGRLRPGRYDHSFEDVPNGNYYPVDQIEWLDESSPDETATLRAQLAAARQAERDLFLSTIRFLNRLQPSQVAKEVLSKYPPTKNTNS